MSRYAGLMTLMLALLMAAAPAHESTSGSTAADLERNRQLLKKWRAEPEHYARLQRDLRDFWALPREKRQRLRRLDHDLYQLDAATQKRLWKAIERYSGWLEKLPEDDRLQIEQTKEWPERLRLIKDLRERQWLDRLPQKVREELLKLPPDQRNARASELRGQERQQRKLWQRPLAIGAVPRPVKQPTRLSEFPRDSQLFVEKNVLPHLTVEERQQYEKAAGQADFVPTVKRLAAKHPVLPPLPAPHPPVTRYENLPERAKELVGPKAVWEKRTEAWRKLHQVEGRWPEWALTFYDLLTPQQRERVPPLGASRPHEFPKPIPAFIRDTLGPKLSEQEKKHLHETVGKWPEYPRLLLELAEKHRQVVPGMSLPMHNEPTASTGK
jgi:hypothetical protein